ncbi:MAG: 5-bromo-4-chloroindolyl phosphate hydrolysis family protein [Pseudomonadota bacterium]
MAQRFGGKYSPGGAGATSPLRGRRAVKSNIWARLLLIAPVPLLIAGLSEVFGGDALAALAEIGGFALLILGAWLLNEGIRAEEAYAARKIARAPALPRKALAAALAGLGVGVAQIGGAGLLAALIFGAMTAAAHVVAFGLDPMRTKGIDGIDAAETERVALAIEGAETLVAEIGTAAATTADRALIDRAEALAAGARALFRTVEADPRDLRRARRFLGVYLQGARDATVKFAALPLAERAGTARAEYLALLTDLEASFATHRARLMEDDRTDLDIEVEVLRERLKQEGL